MPRKTFVAGEILTALDLNTNLMDQAVMTFADATERTAELPSPLHGMVTYLKDTDSLEVFDNSAFVPVRVEPAPPAILQVVSVVKTDTQSGSLTSGAFTAVATFAPSITPVSATSKLLHFCDLNHDGDAAGKLFRVNGGVSIPVGDAEGVRLRLAVGGFAREANSTLHFIDTPGSTTTLNYDLEIGNPSGSTRAFSINRTVADLNNTRTPRATSTWTIMEVAA